VIEKSDKDLKPGKLIRWTDGKIGLLVKRFDYYVKKKVASRDYSPRWHWSIN